MTYILLGQTPVPEPDVVKWARWFTSTDLRVALTEVDGYTVATVFIGLDRRFLGMGPPILFQTTVWSDGEKPDYMARCSTWLEAEEMHREAIKICKENRIPF